MLDTDAGNDNQHEELDDTFAKANDEQNIPWQTLSESSMPLSNSGPAGTPPRSKQADGIASNMSPAPAAGPTVSRGSPITVPIINLGDASSLGSRRRFGSTGQKRKSSALHNTMTNVAKKARESMVQQLRDMSEVSKSTEKEKLQVQIRLFSEQMTFLQENYNRLHENAKAAQRNAELAIQKHGELIRCLGNISFVLGQGLGVASPEAPSQMNNAIVGPSTGRPAEPGRTPPMNIDSADAL
jgi:hypothetical protein